MSDLKMLGGVCFLHGQKWLEIVAAAKKTTIKLSQVI